MFTLLEVEGKKVSMEGDEVTRDEALAIAAQLLETWLPGITDHSLTLGALLLDHLTKEGRPAVSSPQEDLRAVFPMETKSRGIRCSWGFHDDQAITNIIPVAGASQFDDSVHLVMGARCRRCGRIALWPPTSARRS